MNILHIVIDYYKINPKDARRIAKLHLKRFKTIQDSDRTWIGYYGRCVYNGLWAITRDNVELAVSWLRELGHIEEDCVNA